MRVLDLPRLCNALNLGATAKAQCDEVKKGTYGTMDELDSVSMYTVTTLWETMQMQISDDRETNDRCRKLNFCNNHKNQGSCMWSNIENTTTRTMVCACKASYTGDNC